MTAPNTQPIFELTPKITVGTSTLADASLTAPAHAVAVSQTAPTQGSRIDGYDAQSVATTTATMLRLFLYDGANYTLWWEIPVQAITASASQPAWNFHANQQTNPERFPLILPSGMSLMQTINDAETGIKGIGRGGDF